MSIPESLYTSTINSSLAHTCGNISQIVFNHLLDKFPKGFFKSEHVSTRIALKEFSKIDKHGFLDLKKEKPIIAMQPRLQLDMTEYLNDSYRRLYGSDNIDYRRPRNNNNKFFHDGANLIFLEFGVERLKMSFELNYVVSTEFQMYNLVGHVLNKMRFDHPYYENVLVEAEIPDSIINQIAKDTDFDLSIKDNIGNFAKYLNTYSDTPISYRYKSGSGNYKFFLLLSIRVLYTFDGRPNVNEGDKEGQTLDDFIISHTVNIEFNYPNIFFYNSFTPNDVIDKNTSNVDLSNLNATQIIPMMTLQNAEIYVHDENNYSIYISAIYEPEIGVTDITDMAPLFDDDIKAKIVKAKSMGIPDSDILNVIVFKDSTRLTSGSDYVYDNDKMELTTYNCEQFKSYRVVIYVNLLLLNTMI